MNPELIERPHEIAYYKEQRKQERQECLPVVFLWGLTIGFLTSIFVLELIHLVLQRIF